jgi:predicted chitinase
MSYQIKDGFIVAKDTAGSTRKFIKSNVDVIIAECKRRGITNKYLIAGILATISKESGFVPQNENLNYSAEGLLKIFPSKFGTGKENPNLYAKKPEKIGNYVYGGRLGNSDPGDGFKYRGRGFNQITFKDLYKKYGANIPGLLENPDLLNNVSQASIATISFYVESFKNSTIKKRYGKSAYDTSDWNEALLIVINCTAGLGKGKDNQSVIYNYDKAKKTHQFLIDYLEQTPQGTPVSNENPFPVDNNAQSQQEQNSQNDNVQDTTANGNENNSNSSPNGGQPITNLIQFFKPTISPSDITFDIEDERSTKRDREKISKRLGYNPFIWYNGVQIGYKDVKGFNLYHKGILPALDITFFDSWGRIREDGFPNDDATISIYLNSKSLNLRSIHMDFKIIDFKDNGEGIYSITGLCNIPEIYLRRFLSYSNKTSHESLQEVAKQCGIGFCSNIQNSDDKMTWINTGFQNLEFIDNVMLNSYVSDTSFQYCYIDYYYNLCYIDLNKEIERDASQDKMITGFGWKFMDGKEENNEVDEEISKMQLMNDKSLRGTIGFFETFEVNNKSTKVSIQKSYRSRSKFYDTKNKELLVFDVESQTSDGSKSIILKGDPNDVNFFKENTANIWIGKQDTWDDGQGNVHKNYNYAVPQNRQNLDDITKVSCKMLLPNLNFNLYVFQKIPIIFQPQRSTPGTPNNVLKRLTGDWLITSIDFIYNGSSTYQEVTAIKRELSLLPEEESTSPSRSNKNETSGFNTNELTPNEITSSQGGEIVTSPIGSIDPKTFVGPNWKSFSVDDALSRIKTTSFRPNKQFESSLKDTLSLIKNDPSITDIREASYLLGTAFAEAGYSLQRWEADYLYKGAGIPYGSEGPPQRALNYYKSSKGKKDYYTLGVDSKGLPYFGRGLIQLTGKANYEKYGSKIGQNLVGNGDLALNPNNSYRIAVEYLKERTFAKVLKGNLTSARKSVNGGTKGIDEVNGAYSTWVNIFSEIKPQGTNSQV